MPYMDIPFLFEGKQAIQPRYRDWFKTERTCQYESGDIENHYTGREHDLPNGNARRWDYIVLKSRRGDLIRVVFVEPHPIKEGNVSEVLEKLEWLKTKISSHADLQHFSTTPNEFYWIYSRSQISANSNSRRKCYLKGLEITGIPLVL